MSAATRNQEESPPSAQSPAVRILFRVSDGRTKTGEFTQQTRLSEVRRHIVEALDLSKKEIEIMRQMPRHIMAVEDDDKTLHELGLWPTATLYICDLEERSREVAAEREKHSSEMRALKEEREMNEAFDKDKYHVVSAKRFVQIYGAMAAALAVLIAGLPNEFGAINGHIEKQLEVYGGLAKLLAEKAAAEREYGRKVLDLTRAFQSQLSALSSSAGGTSSSAGGIGGQELTEGEVAAATPLELLPAAHHWAVHLEEEGRLHVQLAAKISGDISDELRQSFETLSGMRRSNLDFYQRLLAERDRVYEQKDKSRAQYDQRTKALQASQQKQERATTEKEQEKQRQKAERDAAARNQAKNEYILQVAVANSVKGAINHRFTPRIMDGMQEVDEQRVAATKKLLQQMLAMQEAAASQVLSSMQRAAHVVGRISPEADSALFVRRRVESGASGWEEPPDFRVVVDLASGETDHVVLDGESQVVLRNICLQAHRDCDQAESQARVKAQSAEQIRSTLGNGSGVGTKGVDRELERAAGFDHEATLAELEAVQHQALFQVIEHHLGHVDSGNPHEFKTITVAISRTCDYCGESIGGLSRKAGKCAQCEYTCHAKCQIKVEPSCPGKDPEAKSGFLSMFGTKRGSKKGARARSQSIASSRSNASIDTGSAVPMSPAAYTSASATASASASASALGLGLGAMSTPPQPPPRQSSQSSLPPRSSMMDYGTSLTAAAAAPTATTMATRRGSTMPLGNSSSKSVASRTSVSVGRGAGGLMVGSVPTNDHDTTLVAVVYDFEGDGTSTLTVHAGDRVRVVEADGDGSGWTEVVLINGQQGMVPTAYIDMSSYRAPTAQTGGQQTVGGRALLMEPSARPHASSVSSGAMSLRSATTAAAGGVEYVVALYDFAGRDADELSVKAGDRIQVVSRDIGEGWLQASIDGREGRLPASYVTSE
ncbi:Protein BZZ1 [Coemansia sp. Benny D115]|nr:Protein BZZ1 [Coemansia sp. Benny D115]